MRKTCTTSFELARIKKKRLKKIFSNSESACWVVFRILNYSQLYSLFCNPLVPTLYICIYIYIYFSWINDIIFIQIQFSVTSTLSRSYVVSLYTKIYVHPYAALHVHLYAALHVYLYAALHVHLYTTIQSILMGYNFSSRPIGLKVWLIRVLFDGTTNKFFSFRQIFAEIGEGCNFQTFQPQPQLFQPLL